MISIKININVSMFNNLTASFHVTLQQSSAVPFGCQCHMVGGMVLIGGINACRASSTIRPCSRSSMRADNFFELLAESHSKFLAPVH